MTTELQNLLTEGIAAVRQGDVIRGRDLLLQVVALDERVEPAWLWLSVAVDDPADKLVALENVLTLNPGNARAKAQAEALRQQLGLAANTSPPPTANPITRPIKVQPPPAAVPERTLNSDYDVEEDPYQCVYCGVVVAPSQDVCPHCGKDLLALGVWDGRSYQRSLLVLVGFQLQMTFVQGLAPLFAIALANGADARIAGLILRLPVVKELLGNFIAWSPALAQGLALAALMRVFSWGSLFGAFYSDMESAYAMVAVIASVDLLWAGIAWWLGYGGPWAHGLNATIDAVVLLLVLAAFVSRRLARTRMRVVLDPTAHTGPDLHKRALKYQALGQWALAAAHWRKAVGRNPTEPRYYKAYASAQIKLKRYERALVTLERGREYAPTDPEFKQLSDLARAKKARLTRTR